MSTRCNIAALLKESAHYHQKCVIVVTHSADMAKKADMIYGLKKGVLQVIENRNSSIKTRNDKT